MLIILINSNLTIEIQVTFDQQSNNNQIDTILAMQIDKITIIIQ